MTALILLMLICINIYFNMGLFYGLLSIILFLLVYGHYNIVNTLVVIISDVIIFISNLFYG